MSGTLFCSVNLSLRRFTVDDAAFVFELLNTPAWKKFIGDKNVNSHEDAVKYIKNGPQSMYAKHGYGLWLVSITETGRPIGMCGLVQRDYLDRPDLGFAFLPGFEGKGLAYEASMAALIYVHQHYQLDKIYAITLADNIRSRRLLARCGFVHDQTVTPPGDEGLLLYYYLYDNIIIPLPNSTSI
ncbi:GNAT family N-acetyltransferase [Mucilaginibacter sp. AK015]|uniref:GNAT family N-acetyltransferase n=1 Tax=Mucilaginibacter sp. AK015 TaxID=2723072 RepID=UPI00160DAD6C|nr:GNAT family N-acetyltransferase [Mucilaginibacter sp. AK015]MBB5397794.1 RimJ/RimL family protein N-acetyltransferase [Mucilaginibacter sp. AK015]